MIEDTIYYDEAVILRIWGFRVYLNPIHGLGFRYSTHVLYFKSKYLLCGYCVFFSMMADNIRRGFQDLDLGAYDAPFVLPQEVVRQAAEENRYILVGRPVMSRRQNLRAVLRVIVATMPRNWGLEGIARGRVIEARRFQFVLPSEESMETVLRRGPWAFADRMLVLQKWTPLMDMELLNFIPLWIQICGIPLQYTSREVILHIARIIGQYIQMDYNEESGARLEFVRVRINWDIRNPLKFARNFQFQLGVNTLLRFTYERIRGFCEVCGMLTHDSGACVIQNGGPGDGDDEDSDSGDDHEVSEMRQNQGVIIEEINEEEEQANEDVGAADRDREQETYERNIQQQEEEADDDELWSGMGMRTMFSDDINSEEMLNPIYPFGRNTNSKYEIGVKRKTWLTDGNGNAAKFHQGESSGSQDRKRKKTLAMNTEGNEEDVTGTGGTSTEVRGAVGPEPPLPP